MAKVYYSTVFEQTADQIWSVIRDFNNYKIWGAECGESQIEDGKTGETVGAIRRFSTGDTFARQRLLAQSNRDRFQVYEFCDPSPLPVRNYEATLRVTPIVDGNGAFVEWSATFDCNPGECDRWTEHFRKSFARWLESLRSHLANDGERIRQKMLGAWQLVSWERRNAASNVTYPLGPDAIG